MNFIEQNQRRKDEKEREEQRQKLSRDKLASKNARLAQNFITKKRMRESAAGDGFSAGSQSLSQQDPQNLKNRQLINPSTKSNTLLKSVQEEEPERTYSNIDSSRKASPGYRQQYTTKPQATTKSAK